MIPQSPKENSCFRSVILMLCFTMVFSFAIVRCTAASQTELPVAGKVAADEFHTVPIVKIEDIKREDEGYSYDPKGKRDPFKPFIYTPPKSEKQKKGRPHTPLEELELSQIKLIGVIWGIRNNMAMVEDAAGKGYVIKIGTRIGTNGGQVVKLLKDRVVVREEYPDYFGNIKSKTSFLKLHHDEEGETP